MITDLGAVATPFDAPPPRSAAGCSYGCAGWWQEGFGCVDPEHGS
jgi:hypothetical protein